VDRRQSEGGRCSRGGEVYLRGRSVSEGKKRPCTRGATLERGKKSRAFSLPPSLSPSPCPPLPQRRCPIVTARNVHAAIHLRLK
jgi:hypothetical protein